MVINISHNIRFINLIGFIGWLYENWIYDGLYGLIIAGFHPLDYWIIYKPNDFIYDHVKPIRVDPWVYNSGPPPPSKGRAVGRMPDMSQFLL